MIIHADGKIAGTIGGGLLEARVIKLASFIFKTGCSIIEHISLNAETVDSMDMICGGNLSVLLEFCRHLRKATVITCGQERLHIEPVVCRDNLILFGAGHVSQSVARLACTVNFGITVMDDRPEFANRQRFSHADEILVPKGFKHVFETITVNRAISSS